jgi:outer membrane protein assembly factor BamB
MHRINRLPAPLFIAGGAAVVALTAGLSIPGAARPAGAEDWPQWRGPNRDNRVSGFTAPSTWPRELTQKWKVTVGLGDASPALVGDRVYVFTRQGGEEVTSCLDAASGKVVWQDKYAAQEVTGPAASVGGGHPGPRSSPAVAEGKVCTLGVGGVLSCLDSATGKVVWRKDSKSWPDFFAASSPIIVDGKCIAYLGGRGSGTIGAYDLASGEERWKWNGDGPAYGSPVLMTVAGTKQLVTLTEKSLVGIGMADGKLLWQMPFSAGRYNTSTPIVDGQTVICAGRALKIEKQGDSFAARELWKSEAPNQFNTPVLKDGLLFGLTGRRNFFCMNARTGDVLWTDTAQRGDCGEVLDAGSVLLALTSDSEMVAFKPGNKEYAELAKYKVADTPTWAYPIIAGNRVFVKDHETLALWTMP